MPEISPDTLIDARYKVLTRIGSGGMADVFCAEDLQLGRKVALKLLHRRFAEDAEFVERFRREASSAAGLQHPNVVGVYDRGEWDGTYYIAMEYLPGRTLKDVVDDEAPLDPIRAIDLTVQILKAARFAHRRGIVHRDLKPHNVLVDDEDRAKVTDFGIARAGASDMTETGSIMGTAQYLSPEQAQGHAVSPASDLYAIGVILFELLTGYVPFDAESAVSIALKHVSEPPPPPRAFDPSVPPELEGIVLWALEKDPAQRPHDADAFIAALEEARDRILVQETPAPGQQTAMFAAAAPFPGEAEADAAQPTGEWEAEGVRRRPPWWAWLLLALVAAGVALTVFLVTRSDHATVPSVVGRDLRSATDRLERDGFDVDVVRVNDAKPSGEVIAQDPSGGVEAEAGSTVQLTVSRGPGRVAVPSVDGLGEREARASLTNAGLEVSRIERQPDDSVERGRVIRSSPAAGTPVRRGSGVTLIVSSGPELVAVPDVRTLSQASARQTLTSQGFGVAVSEEVADGAEPGTVIRQSPAPGTEVDPGTTVALVVAQAPPQVAVPGVLGQAAADAVAAITGAGLEPRQSPEPVTDPAQDGVVISQRPDPGTSVSEGAPVRIVVGRYEQPTQPTTPDGPPPDDGGAEG